MIGRPYGEGAIVQTAVDIVSLPSDNNSGAYRYRLSRSEASGGGGGEHIILLFSKQAGEWKRFYNSLVLVDPKSRACLPSRPRSD